MSGGLDVLSLKEEDMLKFLAAGTHLGSTNVDCQMMPYVYKRKADGIYIINLRKTWEKILLAARAIAAIENPADVCVISARPYGMRAILKFGNVIGSTPIGGRFTPGAFTNQIQAAFREPRLLVITDPRIDHQSVTEASYVNIPVVAFCNSDSPLKGIDICIPCNNKGVQSIGLMWWMLAREVLRLRGTISRDHPWDTMPDLYFYRDPDEVEKEEKEEKEAQERANEEAAPAQPEWASEPAIGGGANVGDWADEVPVTGVAIQPDIGGAEEWGKVEDWTTEPVQPMAPVEPAPVTGGGAPAPSWGGSAPGESWD